MINRDKWISSLPNVNTEFNKVTNQLDYDRWINKLDGKNTLIINTNEFIGWFLFEQDKEIHPNIYNIKNAIEIGWRLRKEYWGRGYATEMAIALVDKAKRMKRSVVAHTMIENQASIRVMEKAGLSFVEEFWGNYEPHSNKPDVLYKKIH